MDDPQNTKKPVDNLLKDLYGPSEDLPSDLPTDQSLANQPNQSPKIDSSSEIASVNDPADRLIDTNPSVKPIPPQFSDKPLSDYWPPVPPIKGVDSVQPPWEEPNETTVVNESTTYPSEKNYPKPPIFQTSVIADTSELSAIPQPSVPETVKPVETTGSQTELEDAVNNTSTVFPPASTNFTSPLPPHPEPLISSSVLPTPPEPTPLPKKKSKLLLVLPFLAVIAIGLAVLLFIRGNGIKNTGGPVNLTYWGLFEPNSVFQQVVADYEKTNTNVKINYQQQSGLKEYRERLTNAILKEGGPDIFRIHISWIPMFSNNLSVIPSSVYSTADFNKDYYPSAQSSLGTTAGIVGLPLYFDSLALFYNEDLFRAAGQTPPATWEDLIKSACTLTVRDETGRVKTGGVALGSPKNVDHWSDILGLMLLQNGADLAAPDTCNDQGTCPGSDALTFFSSFVKNSVCRNTEGAFLGSAWSDLLPSSTYAFATGQVAMYFAPSWRVFDIKTLNQNLNFKIVPVPQLSTTAEDKVAWATYWVESVSSNSTNQTEAWKFLKYLSSKEVLEKLYLAETNLGHPRTFGEPYPRVEMASMLTSDSWVSPFISQAPFAKNWYLSSATSDNGINDGIIKYYEDAVNKVITSQDSTEALKTASQGVAQILSRYGVSSTVR